MAERNKRRSVLSHTLKSLLGVGMLAFVSCTLNKFVSNGAVVPSLSSWVQNKRGLCARASTKTASNSYNSRARAQLYFRKNKAKAPLSLARPNARGTYGGETILGGKV